MSSVQTWTPDRAEAYFNGSLIGHVSTFLADAISELSGRGGADGGRPTRPDNDRHVERRSEKSPRKDLFARLEERLWRAEQDRREAWLAQSADVFDLERRLRLLDRGHRVV